MQTLFLVEGHLKSGDQEITKGTFNVIPAGELHGPFFALEDSIQFKYFSASPVYLLRDGTSVFYKEDGNTFTSDAMKAGALQKDNYLK